MAKLKCDKHNRRLMVLGEGEKWVHRTGDQSDCDAQTARIGEELFYRGTMQFGIVDLTLDPES